MAAVAYSEVVDEVLAAGKDLEAATRIIQTDDDSSLGMEEVEQVL